MKIFGTLAREPLQALEVLDRQPEEVATALHQPALEKLLQDVPAGALDVHAAAPREMRELLGHPGRTGEIRAVVADGALVLDDRRSTDRAGIGHLELAFSTGPALGDRPDDLGDHVARLLEDHPVPDPQILPADLIDVVERRPGDGRAGHLDRAQVRNRRHRPGSSDVRDDVLEHGLDLLRRELEGDRPARRTRDHPEALLLVDPVDLHHDAIRLVRQVVPPLAPRFGERDHALDVQAGGTIRVDRQPEARQPVERLVLGRARAGVLDELVEPGRQLPARGHGRIDLAERARAAVARVGVERQAGCLAFLVDPCELRLRHEHLAANVGRDRIREPIRDDLDRPEVGGHVLAGRAVAAGRAAHEPATLIAQGDGQAIDLELSHVPEIRSGFRRCIDAEDLPHASIERPQLIVRERIPERQHRPRVAHLGELVAEARTHALRR